MINESIKRIYIYSPANTKTGGPELLHQLSYVLAQNKVESYMIYFDKVNDIGVHEEFEKYNTIEISEDKIIDDENSLIIVPEVSIFHINNIKKAKKAIWWLSVDNYTLRFSLSKRAKSYGILCAISKLPISIVARQIVKSADYHFCQSFYSREFIKKEFNISAEKIFMLSDYLSDNYLDNRKSFNISKRDIVAYFPKKGFHITKELIDNDKTIEWVPVQNMTTEQVQELLCSAKVYVDFGHFPGKDRVPREAASCGCCVITGMEGAAFYYEDVPITSEYKFENPLEDQSKILALIHSCIDNYEEHSRDFEMYRKIIANEKNIFINEVKELFIE